MVIFHSYVSLPEGNPISRVEIELMYSANLRYLQSTVNLP